jgi:uncharacterized membrane protein
LNIIDRYQFGYQTQSIKFISLVNNLLPLVLLLPVAIYFSGTERILGWVLNWKLVIYAFLIQANAYVFSFALRHSKVSTVGLAAKSADIIIPFGIWVVYNIATLNAVLFSIASTVICFFAFYNRGETKAKDSTSLRYLAYIPIAITVLAVLTPQLIGTALSAFEESIAAAFSIIVWRTFFSLLIFFKNETWQNLKPTKLGKLNFLRGWITVMTQYSFVMATATPQSGLAWPILNGTLFVSTIMSFLFLRENAKLREWVGVLLFTMLGALQFILH